MKVFGLIPARLQSTRLPGKALKDVCGLPAIVHVYKRSSLAKKLDDVWVVTDSAEIRDAVERHGGKVAMTGPHRNGSERIYAATRQLDCDIIVNIQGDEVLVYPDHIDKIVAPLIENPGLGYTIGMTPYDKAASPQDFKAVVNLRGDLLYCSREDIPSSSIVRDDRRMKMVFIVCFTKASLKQFVKWEETPLERREPNEFLRILEHGGTIRTVEVAGAKISLDTESDLQEIRDLMRRDDLIKSYAV